MSSDKHKDLLNIIAIIANRNKDGCTIEELQYITKLPKDIIKNNLDKISSNPEMYFEYQPYEEGGIWRIQNYIDKVDNDNDYVMCLDTFEKSIFDMVISSSNNKLDVIIGKLYGIKEYEEDIPVIGSAINDKKIINVKYRNNKNEVNEMKIEPLALVYYEFENKFYLLGQYNNNLMTYSLERFIKTDITNERFMDNLNIDFDKYLANVWGMESGDRVKVKIKFIKEANVEEKVKRDLQRRIYKTIEEYDDYFIYSDEVIGINSFKQWLRSFGSSAIVLEPKELRDEIVEAVKKALRYYKD
ncbi:hypothetical protein CLOBY_09630 [Clostridium saccharobutylicum]|uniref:WYL domain-containing protein n=1 Tax=Clostridium saccharobutylicum TaxID=169679 RepID=UPI0009839163|nr:WYL domain-containing protein [Clostridium saccharobutylicum]AQS08848.1 hypothetical protein CLOBY_09630 [Clostridium saccharobutylicum]MBC2437772.1 WYL domain-containing protein [Clostridium saccharobutylicum]NSB90196.1 hypothetical protein [Clostridium saccharobutylicum]NYC28804.1 hypothetical protein [Clostridium saccharobutylicum]OOM14729.1 hypothetical protein CLSAB_32180 [Clostridium saccharobutylicum]